MLATMAASLGGLRLVVPAAARGAMLVVIGLAIGSAFSPDLVAGLGRWLWSLGALPLYVVVIAGTVMTYLRRVAGFDRVTAYFAAAPGGLSEIVLLSDRAGADLRKVALVQTLRVVLLVTAIPFAVTKLGLVLPTASGPAGTPTLAETVLLLATGAIGYGASRRLRLPSALLLGPMVASGAVHVAGWVEGAPPALLVAVAQVVVGAAVGSRFAGTGLREVVHALGHGLVMTLLMLALAALLAVLVHPLAGVALLPLLIAYVPGGVAEMALIAFALGIDPAFVATHHLVRILLVVGLAPLFLRRVVGRPDA